MVRQPFLKQGRDRIRQAQGGIPGKFRAGVRRGGNNRRYLVVGQPGDNRRHENSRGNSHLRQGTNRGQSREGRRSPRLHDFPQLSVKRRYRDKHRRRLTARQLRQQIQVTRHQIVLGHDCDRVPKFSQHFQAPTGQLEPPLDRLIGVRHAAHRNDLGFPFGRGQFFAQEFRGVLFDHDSGLKIQSR